MAPNRPLPSPGLRQCDARSLDHAPGKPPSESMILGRRRPALGSVEPGQDIPERAFGVDVLAIGRRGSARRSRSLLARALGVAPAIGASAAMLGLQISASGFSTRLEGRLGRAGLGLAAIGGLLRQGGLGLGKQPGAEEIAAEPGRVVFDRQMAGALHGAQETLNRSDGQAGEPGERADGGPCREALVIEELSQGLRDMQRIPGEALVSKDLGNPCVQARGRTLPSGRLSPRIFRGHYAASFDTLRMKERGLACQGRPRSPLNLPENHRFVKRRPRQGEHAPMRAMFS